jgi:hypothetical protein
MDLWNSRASDPSRTKLHKSEPRTPKTHETMPNRGLRHDGEAQTKRGRDSATQSARASQPRPRAQGPRQTLNNRGSHSPASAPAGKNHFSFVTIDAYQSRAGCCLPVLSGSIEQEHFTKLAVEYLDMYKNACGAKNLWLHPALTTILEELETVEYPSDVSNTLNLAFVECAQLSLVTDAPVSQRSKDIFDANGYASNTHEYVPDEEYETWTVEERQHGPKSRRQHETHTVMYTQAPRAEVCRRRSHLYTMWKGDSSPLSHRRLRLRALELTHGLIPISAPQAAPTRRGLVAPATRCARRLVAPPRPRIPRAPHLVSLPVARTRHTVLRAPHSVLIDR